jgi:hypothetical protein
VVEFGGLTLRGEGNIIEVLGSVHMDAGLKIIANQSPKNQHVSTSIMYSPRIEPDKVERLYRLKQELIASGQKTNMVKLVDEALEKFLTQKEQGDENS